MRTRNHSSGMTFIEVMIVVVIFGILMAVALPNMSGPRDTATLRQASREIASAGMLARQVAITEGKQTYLLLNQEESTWSISYADPSEDAARRSYDKRVLSSDERQQQLPAKVSFEKIQSEDGKELKGEVITAVFYPNGACSGIAISVKSGRGFVQTVDFPQSTSRPEIYDGPPKSPATKLKEAGLNPAEYGLVEDSLMADGPVAGEGFSRTAGWNEDERIRAYTDAAQRMIERARTRQEIEDAGGAGAYYTEATKWGSK